MKVLIVSIFLISSIFTLRQMYAASPLSVFEGWWSRDKDKVDLSCVIDTLKNDIDTALKLFDEGHGSLKEVYKCPLRYCLTGMDDNREKTDMAQALEKYGFYVYTMVTENGVKKMMDIINGFRLECISKENETIIFYKRQSPGNEILITLSFGYGIGPGKPSLSPNITDFERKAYECKLSVPLDYIKSPVFMAAFVPMRGECRHCHNIESIKDSIDESIKDPVEYSKALIKALKDYRLIIPDPDKVYDILVFEKKSTSQ